MPVQDYYAEGFDSQTGITKYLRGSGRWRLFMAGWNEKRRAISWDFKPVEEDEPHNPCGMSGQAATRYKNAAKRHTGTARIYEDDECFGDSE